MNSPCCGHHRVFTVIVLFLNSCSLIILLGGMKSGIDQVTILVSAVTCFLRNQALFEIFFGNLYFSLMLFFQLTFSFLCFFRFQTCIVKVPLPTPGLLPLPLPALGALNLISYMEQEYYSGHCRHVQVPMNPVYSRTSQTLYFLTEFYHSRLFQ